MSENPSIRRIFKHYKGGHYLLFDDDVTHTETGERMVAYGPVFGKPKAFVRPHAMFFGKLDDGRQRFTEIMSCETSLLPASVSRLRFAAAGFALGILVMYLIAAAALLYRWSHVYGGPSFDAVWQTVVFWLYWTLTMAG